MKKIFPILGVAIILMCGFGSCAAVKVLAAAKSALAAKTDNLATVTKGDVIDTVVETGTIDAVKTVEVKSRVSGRLAKLYVDAGDLVTQGQLIAEIDPLETKLLLEQNQAQLSGAISSVQKQRLEIEQRKVTAQADYEQAKQKLIQIEAQNGAQPTLTKAAIEQAQTALNSAIQDRDRLQNSVQPNERVSAKATQREAQANYDVAISELNRQQELLTKGYTPAKSVEDAKQQVDVTKAQLDVANDALARIDSQLKLELAKANEQIKQAQAALNSAKANSIQDVNKRQDYYSAQQDVAKAKAALEDIAIMEKGKDTSQATVDQMSSVVSDAQRQMKETQIRAPITGVVSKRLMQEGELVASLSSFSSGSPIVDIEDRRQMRVTLDVNEIDVAKMAINMPADVTVDALPAHPMHGVVKKISPSSETATAGASDPVVKYQVEIYITDAPKELRSGMSAKCSMEVVKHPNVLQLPLEFVAKDGNQHYVEIPPANSKDPKAQPLRQNVVTGAETGTNIEIVSGLAAGDKVQRPAFNGPARKGMVQMGADNNGG